MTDSRAGVAEGLRVVCLSALAAADRERLLGIYERTVYNPAFPDAEIREDPGYWLGLLAADPYPPSPQPRIEVILLVTEDEMVAGGATVELYRAADSGLLTYLSVAADRRGRGLGRLLVAEARLALARMAEGRRLLFAETERLEDAADDAEREATIVRQATLARLGASLVDFDYWMPPLRPGLPAHPLHLLVFDEVEPLSGRLVLRLLEELARALGTDLARFDRTRLMARGLAADPLLPILPLAAAAR